MGRLLKEGDIIELNEHHTVYADIPEHFVYENRKGCFALTHSKAPISNFGYLAGRYVVYKTAMEGGGCAHGPHDVFPDGHHVYCERLTDGVRVDFYQSGCFTAVIRNIPITGRAAWRETGAKIEEAEGGE